MQSILDTPRRRAERLRTLAVIVLCLMLFLLAGVAPAQAVRLKDIANFSGVRNNELVGYGLVVGLDGSGGRSSQAHRAPTQGARFLHTKCR